MNIVIESNIVIFNRQIHVPKYTVSNIISNSLIINELYRKMCFVNWRIRSFVQYISSPPGIQIFSISQSNHMGQHICTFKTRPLITTVDLYRVTRCLIIYDHCVCEKRRLWQEPRLSLRCSYNYEIINKILSAGP